MRIWPQNDARSLTLPKERWQDIARASYALAEAAKKAMDHTSDRRIVALYKAASCIGRIARRNARIVG